MNASPPVSARAASVAGHVAVGAKIGARAHARAAVLAVVGFHLAYVVFHLAHVRGHDVPLLAAISEIPLFGTIVASAGSGLLLGALGLARARDEWRLSPSRLLSAVIVLFVFAITVWP